MQIIHEIYLRNPSQKKGRWGKKKAGGVAQGVDPEIKPQYCKKRK
jgi:hypothetical protein